MLRTASPVLGNATPRYLDKAPGLAMARPRVAVATANADERHVQNSKQTVP